MEQKYLTEPGFRQTRTSRLFNTTETPEVTFPIQSVLIDWDSLIAKRPLVFKSNNAMPAYLLKPEVLQLLDAEKHPTYRLIMDIMWTTGACISEVLALKPNSFVDNDKGLIVTLRVLKKSPGRPTKASLQRSPTHEVQINDYLLEDRIRSYLHTGHYKKTQRIFPMVRQTVNRHINALVDKVGGAPFSISCKTFRHSFAIHLLLHGRPLEAIRTLLGNRSIHSTEIYTNVLTIYKGHFLEGVDFH